MDVAQQLTSRGQYLGGNPLHPTSATTSVRMRDGKRLVTDGPFAETREQLGGYMLIDVKDLDEALPSPHEFCWRTSARSKFARSGRGRRRSAAQGGRSERRSPHAPRRAVPQRGPLTWTGGTAGAPGWAPASTSPGWKRAASRIARQVVKLE